MSKVPVNGRVNMNKKEVNISKNKISNIPHLGACSATPTSGTNLTLQDCTSNPAGAINWRFVLVAGEAGIIQLDSNPSLCAVNAGVNPDTNQPNIALGTCNRMYFFSSLLCMHVHIFFLNSFFFLSFLLL